MKPGDVSEPVRTPSGFHIVKLNERRSGEAQVIINQIHVRHILMKTNELDDDETVRQKLAKLRERILKGEDFAGIASTTSADPGSAPDGGDLGWSGPGTFVPEFDKAIADLKANEISEPFKTRYGWHIVQMLGTRTYDSTDDVRRQRAFAAIRESKADEETELWLRRLARRGLRRSQDVCAAPPRIGSAAPQRCTYRGSSSPRVSRPASGRTPASRSRSRLGTPISSWPPTTGLLAATAAALGAAARRSSATMPRSRRTRIARAALKVLHIPTARPVIAGKLDARNAAYVIDMLDRACDGCMNGEFAAMVTAPVQKSTLMDGGFAFTGHTEYLAAANAGRACRSCCWSAISCASRW